MVDGNSYLMLGKQLRFQPEGKAFMVPPDGNTPHSNINTGSERVKMLYYSILSETKQ